MVRNDGTCEGKLNGKWEEERIDNGKSVVPQYVRIKTITGRRSNIFKPSEFQMSKLSRNISYYFF